MDSDTKSDKCQNSEENEVDCVFQNEFKLGEDLEIELQENYPDVLDLINTLRKYIEKQQAKIRRLKLKLKKKASSAKTAAVQTDDQTEAESTDAPKTFSEEIKEAAEMAMQKTGFVYEETSGLYYDYNTGYYYNAELGLYYDGNNGTYMTYNAETQAYDFHSQVDVIPNVASSPIQPSQEDKFIGKKRKKKNRNKSKVITSCDMGNLVQSFTRMNITSLRKSALETAKAWPPCMRIIVKSTAVAKLKEGTLYIITYEGGTLGREGDHAVLIPDINISKHHLKFSFDKTTSQYAATDLGSRNGTILNGKRISASKQESDPMEISHGSQIQIGSTILLCHIHNGNETCGHCEPGLLQVISDVKEEAPKLTKNEQHKSELRKLRKKFGVNWSDASSTQLAAGYMDRAQVRRQTVGSQNAHEKTQVASVDDAISSDNKGFKLLSKMGWSEGQSLGKEGTGVLKPVELVSTVGTAGVGYASGGVSNKPTQPIQERKNIWEKTQKRYQQLPDSSEIVYEDVDNT